MSPERRAEVVELLVGHQWALDSYTEIEPMCVCGEVPERGTFPLDRWMASHQIDMLVEAGFEPFRPIDVVPSGP